MMRGMGAEEKRSHPRTSVDFAAEITTPSGAVLRCRIENLGQLGALVSTAELEGTLVVGDRVQVKIERGDEEAIAVDGEVLRVDQEFVGGDVRRAMAVRFSREIHV